MPDLKYDESSFQHYEGVDAVRMRVGMYLQQLGPQGVFRCIQEIAGNSLDEFRSGRATKLIVFINEENSMIRIDDDGSGIPIGKIISAATELHSGAKFGNDAYKYSIGLNGVGLTCTNATAEWCKIEVHRDHKQAVVEFKKGKIFKPLVVTDYKGDDHGTSVTWIPDVTIFDNVDIESNMYRDYFEKLSYINNGVKIELNCKLMNGNEIHEKYYSKNGMIDYLKERILVKHKQTIPTTIEFPHYEETREVVFGKSSRRDVESQTLSRRMGIELCFTWVSDTRESSVLSFVNGIQTTNDGAHVIGIRQGIASVIRSDLREYLGKKDPPYEKFVMDDFFEGFTCVLLAFHESPMFDGQTKNHFTSEDYEPFAEQYTKEKFSEWSRLNPSRYKAILNQIVLSAKARLAAIAARNNVKPVKAVSTQSLLGINRYEPCKLNNPEVTELFIVEGDSAGGSAKSARDVTFQATYRMMGKPLNTYGMSKNGLENVAKREGVNTIGDLMKIIGSEGSRFRKYIIMADADADGGHITSLLLGFFFTFRPDLIRDGYVYAANPPLFLFKFNRGKSKEMYISTDDMYNRIVESAIMKDFDLMAIDKKGKLKPITNKKFFKQYLINLRNYSSIVDMASSQAVVKPTLLESFVAHYDEIMSHPKVRINGWDMEVHFDKDTNCTVIEGIYDYVFHKVEVTPFFMKQASMIVNPLKKIHWSNIVLVHKKTGTKIGPSPYVISSTIDKLVNSSASITRFKGLGEMDAEQLWDTTMNPETRTLTQITMDDSRREEYVEWLNKLLGDDIVGRKEYYKQYL